MHQCAEHDVRKAMSRSDALERRPRRGIAGDSKRCQRVQAAGAWLLCIERRFAARGAGLAVQAAPWLV
jgi:hypothetical protein